MNSIKSILLTLFFGMIISQISAQFARGEKKYNNFQYADAIPYFHSAIQKDSSNLLAWERLSECYRLTNQIKKAENCYAQMTGQPNCSPIYKYYYAQMLLSNETQYRAKFWFQEYKLDDPTDNRANDFIAAIEKWDTLVADSNRYTVKKLNINSQDADFGAVPYKDGIIFSSSRKVKEKDMKRDSWTGTHYMSIYFAKGSNENFSEPELFAKPIQTQFNNGPICFNNNGTEMYLTRNNTDKFSDSNVQIDKLKIFSIVLENGNFSDTKPFPYNDDKYSCAHPVINPDGTQLYFSSDMPGGYGGMDIWVCEKVTEGWGAPQNLGPKINTKGNEIFPSINNDGKLYFSSNGLGGIGGLDIFSTTFLNGEYSKPFNLGSPINSHDDDFSFFYDLKSRSGYFSSNRGHQGYNDDIYAFTSNEIILLGQVFDKITNQPMSESLVRILDHGRESDQIKTDKDGRFKTYVIPNKDYTIIAENSMNRNDTTYLHVDNLLPSDGELSFLMTVNNKLEKDDNYVLNNILYDFDKYDIREDAAKVLDGVVTLLNENPQSKIELSSHTDCRASDKYNNILSKKRAKAAAKYLVRHGISKDRVLAVGYGKSKLLIQCDCDEAGNTTCSETDHQANRRTEIKVLE